MAEPYRLTSEFIEAHNEPLLDDLKRDWRFLTDKLERRGFDIEELVRSARTLRVAIPSWGVGTGGTRFARFPGPGEPRNLLEKLDDCAAIQQLVRCTPAVSLHIPWDKPDDPHALRQYAADHGLSFDAMNSNTFQDQPEQRLSYKFGSLTHTDPAVRRQAIAHNIECIEIGRALGSKVLTVWIADGSNFPGQQSFRGALERYLESLSEIHAALPEDWRIYLEHKLFEPAFYSTVVNDWGTSYWCARELGPKAYCLVDLGHHAPTTNIEMIVSRLIQLGKLGGFHFNDSKYGDDDLDTGSINPFQLFLVFHELVTAQAVDPHLAPAYMLDQSHNVSDPLESLMMSAMEVQRAYVQALLVDRKVLAYFQQENDALMALRVLKEAFQTDVSPVLAMARLRAGGAIDPVAALRVAEYRKRKSDERAAGRTGHTGIV
ncbi:MAG: L-rhamnose catabolism isomerase [Planctomycetota bacterium]